MSENEIGNSTLLCWFHDQWKNPDPEYEPYFATLPEITDQFPVFWGE